MHKAEDLERARTSKHSFRNAPNNKHQVCVTCGCRRVISYKNQLGKAVITYFDRYGKKLVGCPTECKSLLELMEEQQ